MSEETCLKCGHVNPAATGSETEACPQCGAIYARVKAAMASGQPVRSAKSADSGFPARNGAPAAPPKPPPKVHRYTGHTPEPFINNLRDGTHYPAFRTVVRLGLFFGYFLAVCGVIGGIAAMINRDGTFWHLLIGLGAAAVVFLLTRIWFELTIMIVDIADASVRTAENSEQRAAS